MTAALFWLYWIEFGEYHILNAYAGGIISRAVGSVSGLQLVVVFASVISQEHVRAQVI
jgi:hypothetical protein